MTDYIVQIHGETIDTRNLERGSKKALMDFVMNPQGKYGIIELFFNTNDRLVMKIPMNSAGVLSYTVKRVS